MTYSDAILAYQWWSTGMRAKDVADDLHATTDEVYKAITYVQDQLEKSASFRKDHPELNYVEVIR